MEELIMMASNPSPITPNTSMANDDDSPETLKKINRLRSRFLQRVATDPGTFHPADIDLVERNDWWTLRFLKWNRHHEDKALKQMIAAFQWRHKFGLNDRTVQELPIEFAKSGSIFPLGYDYKGRHVVYVRVKVYRKVAQLNEFFQQFVAGIINYVDEKSGPNGYVMVYDVTGMGWDNVDLDFLKFIAQLLQSYFPYGVRYSICHNVPRLLRPLWTMMKMFVGSRNADKVFRFTDGPAGIQQYIPAEHLPRYLGGQCDFDFTDFEETRHCPSVRELGPKYGIKPDEVERLYKVFEPNLLEAERLAKCASTADGHSHRDLAN